MSNFLFDLKFIVSEDKTQILIETKINEAVDGFDAIQITINYPEILKFKGNVHENTSVKFSHDWSDLPPKLEYTDEESQLGEYMDFDYGANE